MYFDKYQILTFKEVWAVLSLPLEKWESQSIRILMFMLALVGWAVGQVVSLWVALQYVALVVVPCLIIYKLVT